MTSKTLMTRALLCEKTPRQPVACHWWGVYKYEATGRDALRDTWQEGAQIAQVYADFYDKFSPDWFHLHIGTPKYFKGAEVVQRDGKMYLAIDPSQRAMKARDKYFSTNTSDDEEIIDIPDYILASRANRPKVDLSSRTQIDAFMERYIHMDAAEIRDLGYTDHVAILAEWYGAEAFLAVHIPSAICEIFDPMTGYLGFEEGLTAFSEYPDGMQYLLERCYRSQLEWAKAFAAAGANAYIVSESYISPDIANPSIYRNFMKHIHHEYFGEVSRMGLIPLGMFWGNINPILEDLTEINVQGILIEESKKGFDLDVVRIRGQIGERLCVFGNVDSMYLLHDGTPDEIQAEVARQTAGAPVNFVLSNGSPLTPGTPEANVRTMIAAAKTAQR